MTKLCESTYRNRGKSITDDDLVEASKGIHAAIKTTIPSMVKSEMVKLVGSILHKEIDNRLVDVTKSYEDRISELRKSYETRLTDLQYSNDKNLDDIKELIKAVTVPGTTEDVGIEIISRATKMLDTKVEKRLGEIVEGFESKLKALWEGVASDLDVLKKTFEGEQNRMIEIVKNLTFNLIVPENAIHSHVEVKQLPSVVNFTAPRDSFKVEAKAIIKEAPAPVVNIPSDAIKVNIEQKSILYESDKVIEKSIVYDEHTGRPTLIKEKTLLDSTKR